jgi:hypothetical protein
MVNKDFPNVVDKRARLESGELDGKERTYIRNSK